MRSASCALIVTELAIKMKMAISIFKFLIIVQIVKQLQR